MDTTNNMVYLFLGHSKTNNFCTRDMIVPILGNNDPAMDIVHDIHRLYTWVKKESDCLAFSYSERSYISHIDFTTHLKEFLQL